MIYLIVILLCMMPQGVIAMGPMSSAILAEDKAATDFTLPTTSGKSLSLTEARDVKKSVLLFWATWCPHCREELERIRQNIESIKAANVQIILINAGESREVAESYLKQQEIPLDSFLDEDNEVSSLYNVVGLPTLFFIDVEGIIRDIKHGMPSNYEELFQ